MKDLMPQGRGGITLRSTNASGQGFQSLIWQSSLTLSTLKKTIKLLPN